MISRFNIWQVSWSRPWSCSTSDTSPRVLCFQEGGRIPRVPLRIQHWITSHLMTKIHPDTMFFSQRTSLCLAAKPYKPRGSFDAGPWSQELCDRARLRPQTMNLQPPCAEVSSGSCQSQMENTTTSFLLSHNVSWPGAVSPQISIRKELASVGQDSCYEPRLPAAWCGGCAGQAHVAESLHAHSLPSLMRAVSLAWGTPQLHAYMQWHCSVTVCKHHCHLAFLGILFWMVKEHVGGNGDGPAVKCLHSDFSAKVLPFGIWDIFPLEYLCLIAEVSIILYKQLPSHTHIHTQKEEDS